MVINWKRAALVIGMVLAVQGFGHVAAATTVADEPASFKKFGAEDKEANSEKIAR